jgi:hypothetical protein
VSQPTEGRYEHTDVDARRVVLTGFVLALLLVGSMALSAWISQSLGAELAEGDAPSPVQGLRKAPDGPELLAVPARELEKQRAWEEDMLTGTEWIDPVNQVVRIPIERALELALQEGFPVREEQR